MLIEAEVFESLGLMSDVEDVQILEGVVSKDHVHMHIEYPSELSISDLMKRLKGRTSWIL